MLKRFKPRLPVRVDIVLKADRGVYFLLLAAAAALSVFLGDTAQAVAATTNPATHTVVIKGIQFDPQVLTVKVGDLIVWINRDPFPHTATADGKQFDSLAIEPGRSWTLTAKKAAVIS